MSRCCAKVKTYRRERWNDAYANFPTVAGNATGKTRGMWKVGSFDVIRVHAGTIDSGFCAVVAVAAVAEKYISRINSYAHVPIVGSLHPLECYFCYFARQRVVHARSTPFLRFPLFHFRRLDRILGFCGAGRRVVVAYVASVMKTEFTLRLGLYLPTYPPTPTFNCYSGITNDAVRKLTID